MAYAPQLKEIVLKSLGRQHGPAVDDTTNRAIAQYQAGQFANRESASAAAGQRALAEESLGNRVNLNDQRLAASEQQFADTLGFNTRRFDEGQEFGRSELERKGRWYDQGLSDSANRFNRTIQLDRDRMDFGRGAGNLANIISAINLGVSGFEAHNERKRAAEAKKARDELISSYKKMGDDRNQTTARLLELMRID